MKIPQPRKLPSGNWNIRVMIGGEALSITRPTRRECEQEAAFQKAAAATGNRKIVPKDQRTVGEIVDAYIKKYRAEWSPQTVASYESKRRTRFKAVMDRPYSAVRDWQSVIDDEAEDVSSKTLSVAWGLICSALRDADLPVPKVKTPDVISQERPFLYPDQIPAFIAAVKDTSCEMGALLGLHGLRRCESTAVRRGDVDLAHGIIHVRRERLQVKGGYVERDRNKTVKSSRPVPIMSQRLRDLIAAIDDPDAPLCGIAQNTLYKQINRVCRANNLPDVGTHGLRGSFCALCFRNGIPSWRTKEIGGWSSIAIVEKHYAHFRALHVAEIDPRLLGMLDANPVTNAVTKTQSEIV